MIRTGVICTEVDNTVRSNTHLRFTGFPSTLSRFLPTSAPV